MEKSPKESALKMSKSLAFCNQNMTRINVSLRMMKIASGILFLTAVLGAVYSFVKLSAAGRPYPDATQALLASQQQELRLWGACVFLGIFASFLGILGLGKSPKS